MAYFTKDHTDTISPFDRETNMHELLKLNMKEILKTTLGL